MQVLVGAAPTRAQLPEEPRNNEGPLLTSGMSYIGSELTKLQREVTAFAAEVAPTVLTSSGCAASGAEQATCLAAWSTTFAERALRRPLRTGESERLTKIAAAADGTADADKMAVEGLLTAIFFAPSFLYRTEIGAASASEGGARRLAPHELAAKLSYLATLGPPDEELVSAAKAGLLANGEERAKHFDRLSKTELGRRAQALFVLEWLGANEPKVATKSASYLTGLPADADAKLRSSADKTIDRVLGSEDPTVANLLSTDVYLGDEIVRDIAGGSGDATGDDSSFPRKGLLMHPLVLASHTKENGSSPFQIGVFLRSALLCDPVKPPPPGASGLAKTEVIAGLSMREDLEYRTNAGQVCSSCHSTFAPLGFAFIAFDPVGRWLPQDPSGKPWDFSGDISTYSGTELKFDSPGSLATELADTPQVHACFAQVAVEWSLGRTLSKDDLAYSRSLQSIGKTTRGNVPTILRDIVRAPEFDRASSAR
jgi:hypothetical protein